LNTNASSSDDAGVILSPEQATLPWLKSVFQKQFPEAATKLCGYSIKATESVNASTAVLRLEYDGNFRNFPDSVFVKCCKGGRDFVCDSEFLYYTRDYAGLRDAPIPKCFDAKFSRSTGDYHLVLEDLSSSHYSNKDVAPSLESALTFSTELARLHAFRWGKLSDEIGTDKNSSSQLERFYAEVQKGLPPIMNALSSDFPLLWRDAIDHIFDKHIALMMRRTHFLPGHTLIHGDANPTNVLSPILQTEKTFIIDRQPFSWSITYWLGVYDLIYGTIPFWDIGDRRRFERQVLQRYHEALIKFGVTDYPWENCLSDYRLCIAHGVFVAVSWGIDQAEMQQMRWLWTLQLERSLTAFFDWECDNL
jgi:Ecdysteroid kinase-like family